MVEAAWSRLCLAFCRDSVTNSLARDSSQGAELGHLVSSVRDSARQDEGVQPAGGVHYIEHLGQDLIWQRLLVSGDP